MLVQVGGCWCGASAQEDLFSEGSSRELDGNHDASTPLQESRTRIIMGGGAGIAIGAGLGAGLGVVFGAAWDALHPSG